MEQIITSVKSLLVTLVSVLLAYLAPISDMVFVIFFIFLVNCIAGIIAGIGVDRERFNLKKFFRCIFETFVFYVLVVCVYVIGEHLGNQEGAIQCITGIVYAICYFYGVNILRNTAKLFPASRAIRFFYYVLSFEIIKKIPYMQQFQGKEKEVEIELKEDQ